MVGLALVPGPAAATPVGPITFDDLAPGTVVTDQFSALGVTFDKAEVLADPAGVAHSGPNWIEVCVGAEFACPTPIRMDFSATQAEVSLFVGYSGSLPQAVTVALTGLDVEDVRLDGVSATTTLGPSDGPVPISAPLIIDDTAGRIRAAEVTISDSDTNFDLAVDDVSFVPAMTDLALALPDLPTFDAAAGTLTETATITNAGTVTSPQTSVVATAEGWEPARATVPGLPAGGNAAIPIELTVPDAARGTTATIDVTVDPDGTTGDSNTDNNTVSFDVPVPSASTLSPSETGPTTTTGSTGSTGPTQIPTTPASKKGGLGPLLPIVIGIVVALLLGLAVIGFRARPRPSEGRGARAPSPRARPPVEEEAAPPPPVAPPVRTVSTGFSDPRSPGRPLDRNLPLDVARPYLFWLEIGEPVAGAIEERPTPIDLSRLPPEAILTVVLFAFEGGLEVEAGGRVGLLRLGSDEQVVVAGQPAVAHGLDVGGLGERRLFFPVRTPRVPGVYTMRANIYYQRVLIQSRRVSARVGPMPPMPGPAIHADVDYTFTQSLDFARIAQRQPHRLSLMVNQNGEGSAGFMFFADDGRALACPAQVGEGEIAEHVNRARQRLREVAYEAPVGTQEPRYRYGGPVPPDQLRADLVKLAVAGAQIYFSIRHRLACGDDDDPLDRMETVLRAPGFVEVISKISPSFVLPVGMLYDHPVSDVGSSGAVLCDRFMAVHAAGTDIEELECFEQGCAHLGDDMVVCPSGFWGYRHDVGLPASLARDGRDSSATDGAPIIPCVADPIVDATVATDLDDVDAHLTRLRQFLPGLGLPPAATRASAFTLFRGSAPQVVYFYCHGGTKSERVEGSLDPLVTPYLRVGAPEENVISVLNIQTGAFPWKASRPLVFINGCHTTALDPLHALQFVSAFVEDAYASGVIGTEITVYEPLATAFAEVFFKRFVQGDPVGRAVRAARLALLAAGNPLGLAYVPFVAPDLTLERPEGHG